jgi:hypothetical protein
MKRHGEKTMIPFDRRDLAPNSRRKLKKSLWAGGLRTLDLGVDRSDPHAGQAWVAGEVILASFACAY